MENQDLLLRREWLRGGGRIAAGFAALGSGARLFGQKESKAEEDVSPAEDLMREHGVLKRVLLIYREVIARLDAKREFPPDGLLASARLIRNFVEDYHEKLEEDHLFPRFRKAKKLVELVDVLGRQHQAGRVLTDRTIGLATAAALKDPSRRASLRADLQEFVRMYEPHEAREDTVLFPALREIVSGNEYDSLGEDFEKKEHQLFGEDGFEGKVEEVAAIEKKFGLYDLAQYTPRV